MANRIKGITVELGGDTTKLDKALKNVNSTISSTKLQLRDVEKLLKLDPKNTELLKQKQDLLNNSIKATEDKLKTLKEASAQANQKLKDGTMTKEQYDALQREIVDTEQSLKKLKEQAKDFGSVGAQKIAVVGEAVKEVGGKVEEVGQKLSVVSAGIVALGTASVSAFKEVDAGLDTIVKKTGASGEQLEGFEEIFDNLASSLPVDLDAVGSAIGEVNTRFGITGDELESVSAQFLKFAKLNNTDVSSAIDSVQKSMATFGIDTKDTGAFLDTLNKVGQDTGITMDKLTSSIVSNGSYLKELGLNASSSATFLGKLEKSGIDTSAVMTGLRTAIKNAGEQGIPLNQALQDIEASLKNAGTEAEATGIAVDLFGSRAGVQLSTAIRDGTVSLVELSNTSVGLKDSLGSVNDTFNTTLSGTDSLTTSSNQLKITLGELGETISSMLGPVLDKLNGLLQRLQDGWNKLSPEAQNTIVKIGMIVAAIGPAILIIGKVISTIGTLMTYAPAIIGFLTGPIAPIVALVAAIGLLVGVIIKNWNNIKSIISNIKGIISDLQVVIHYKITQIKETIVNKFKEIVSSAKNWGRDMIQGFIDGITAKVKALTDKVKGVATTISDFLHFSVPEKGPLADFDKSMPDMIDLMVKGIDQNKYKLKDAVDGLATNVAQAPQNYNGVLGQILTGVNSGSTIVLDTGELVGATAKAYNRELGNIARLEVAR